MKQSLQLKLSQHLTLTPQLQQSIRLLQLSTLELNQEVERILQENPLLERADQDEDRPPPPYEGGSGPAEDAPAREQGEETARADYADEGGSGMSEWLAADHPGSADDDDDYTPQPVAATSLRDHLNWQLSCTTLSQRDRQLVALLVEALDEDAYLTSTLEEVAEMLPEELGVEPEELTIALKVLQSFEPVGVGARSPAECLELQLLAKPAHTPYRDLALAVVRDHLPLLAARDFGKLKRALHCDDVALRETQKLIQSLNPRPGASYSSPEGGYVVPDVIVSKVKGHWTARLNEAAVPKLRLNRLYADILSRHRDSAGPQLVGQLQEAKWLIKNVQQRFETILRVSQAIVDRQRHFFEHGEVAMRPLVLREIADQLGLHESTVSRVTTQKYMLSPRGTLELKYFFGSHVATDTGGAASSTAIRALIKQLIAEEDARAPLTDSRIAEVLGEQGIVVARRTIAKYREALQIPPVNLRRSL